MIRGDCTGNSALLALFTMNASSRNPVQNLNVLSAHFLRLAP